MVTERESERVREWIRGEKKSIWREGKKKSILGGQKKAILAMVWFSSCNSPMKSRFSIASGSKNPVSPDL